MFGMMVKVLIAGLAAASSAHLNLLQLRNEWMVGLVTLFSRNDTVSVLRELGQMRLLHRLARVTGITQRGHCHAEHFSGFTLLSHICYNVAHPSFCLPTRESCEGRPHKGRTLVKKLVGMCLSLQVEISMVSVLWLQIRRLDV